MELVQEEFSGSNDHSPIRRRKRASRKRPFSPSGVAVTSSSSMGGDGGGGDTYFSTPSPTSTGGYSTSKEEDEDMAYCLILLAQGGDPKQLEEEEEEEGKIGKCRKEGLFGYECKTCNRTFPSFQALGGHRASHTKPKPVVGENMSLLSFASNSDDEKEEGEGKTNKMVNPSPLSLHLGTKKASYVNNKSKLHGCSICGVEFSSGQALGGHMRRHRAPQNANIPIISDGNTSIESHEESNKKPRKFLSLDLNLPAPPEDDHHRRDSEFQFNDRHMVFSGPALVDCYY